MRASYTAAGNPVISVDGKKKELIGNLFRDGKVYSTKTVEVYDPDFPSLAEGVAVPHALYDIERATNPTPTWGQAVTPASFPVIRFVTGGTPMKASTILWQHPFYYGWMAGGSNSSRHSIFKQDLQSLVEEIGIEIRIAHHPQYTFKWNPMEHRVFPHIILGNYPA